MGLMKAFEWMLGKRNEPQRWVDERFLRVACDAMAAELDWDSLDSGRYTPLWLYVPVELPVPEALPEGVVLKRL